jgi:hypothetical protein
MLALQAFAALKTLLLFRSDAFSLGEFGMFGGGCAGSQCLRCKHLPLRGLRLFFGPTLFRLANLGCLLRVAQALNDFSLKNAFAAERFVPVFLGRTLFRLAKKL